METNANPNERQVGGSHYKPHTERQHWDVMDDYQFRYLEGCASKYLMRFRDKGKPRQDLEKAQHYVEKLLYNHINKGREPSGRIPLLILDEFLTEHDVHGVQRSALYSLLHWRSAGDLANVLNHIETLKNGHPEE